MAAAIIADLNDALNNGASEQVFYGVACAAVIMQLIEVIKNGLCCNGAEKRHGLILLAKHLLIICFTVARVK